ncbi:MAG: 4Fe-4S dicluster domain-containing protein [Bacteroides sp.]|nr:4Fe-4S dicluster domain-containing protein [Bacteroides sp.]
MKGKWLRAIRIAVSVVAFSLITGLFVSFGMTIPGVAAWLARIQLLPAAMAFGMTVFVGWLIVTMIFGRVYCSSVCPMGFYQDICARGARLTRRSRRRRAYHFTRPSNVLRYSLLALTAGALITGIGIVPVLLDPYSAYGRMALCVLKPVWGAVAGLFSAEPLAAAGGSALGMTVAVLTAIAVGWAAARNGRTVCNTICPVGTTLGLVSRYSVFHIDINPDKCVMCHRCEHACKARCIDLPAHTVDTSRCVVCFDCLPVCPNDAISYTPSSHRLQLPMLQRINERRDAPEVTAASPGVNTPDAASCSRPRLIDRRKFLATGAIVAAAPLITRADRAARAVAAAAGAVKPSPSVAVYPPGAADRTYFIERCTGCGLCVSHCPTGVIRPATLQYGTVKGILHPVMDYDAVRCAFDCTRCNNLCPTGALLPLTLREKQSTVIGRAHPLHANCIHCGHCAKACPRGAIEMTGFDGSKPVPIVNHALCIGCGACQSVCPSYPYKAIYVDGLTDQK